MVQIDPRDFRHRDLLSAKASMEPAVENEFQILGSLFHLLNCSGFCIRTTLWFYGSNDLCHFGFSEPIFSTHRLFFRQVIRLESIGGEVSRLVKPTNESPHISCVHPDRLLTPGLLFINNKPCVEPRWRDLLRRHNIPFLAEPSQEITPA